MHESQWKKFLVVNILTMIVGFQGLVIKTPQAIYIQYADKWIINIFVIHLSVYIYHTFS